MLDDRSYMRGPDYTGRRPVVNVLLGLLVAAFVIQCLAIFYGKVDVLDFFGLRVEGLRHGRVWQLFTYQFLHSYPWPWHLLGNCLGLYFFGREIEMALGPKKFLTIYFVSGLAGGLLQILTTLVLPNHGDPALVGASAGVCGIIATFAMLFPMREGTFIIYFFPVNIRAFYFLIFLAGLSIFGTLFPFDNVAHAAHLGGLLVGIGYVRWLHESNGALQFLRALRPKRRNRPVIKVRFPKTASSIDPVFSGSPTPLTPPGASGSLASNHSPGDEFISKEIDPILDKILAHGPNSLTPEERRILESARSRMKT